MGNNVKLKLKEIMTDRSLSIRKLSIKTGISRTCISNLISEKYNNPTIGILVTLAKALDVTIDELIEY